MTLGVLFRSNGSGKASPTRTRPLVLLSFLWLVISACSKPQAPATAEHNVANVNDAEGNIHAGAKMMRNIADTYFNDPGINALNKTLFTFASYNAGPNRIARLRDKTKDDGLDPNKWFGNVELEVAKSVGQETVTYVSNIYKYYVAYKLTAEEKASKAGTSGK